MPEIRKFGNIDLRRPEEFVIIGDEPGPGPDGATHVICKAMGDACARYKDASVRQAQRTGDNVKIVGSFTSPDMELICDCVYQLYDQKGELKRRKITRQQILGVEGVSLAWPEELINYLLERILEMTPTLKKMQEQPKTKEAVEARRDELRQQLAEVERDLAEPGWREGEAKN